MMNISDPINLEKLERLPKSKDIHIWADYVELLCMVSPDGMISKSLVVDRINERNDVGEESPDEDSETDEEYDFDSLEETRTMPSARDAKIEREVEDVFLHLDYRAGVFSEFYPFNFSSKGNTLIIRSDLDRPKRLYLFLLLAANLWCIKDKKTENIFADIFEIASLIALKSYLPIFAEVHVFGSNSYNVVSRYSGSLWKKIRKLAKDIFEVPTCSEEEFNKRNYGDGGLDLVGWVSIGDLTPGMSLVFGQCACSEDRWTEKQHSSSRYAWSNKLRFTVPPTNMVFIPICFRDSLGNWHDRLKIMESIVIDRVRLVHLLKRDYSSIHSDTFDLIDQALVQKMPTV